MTTKELSEFRDIALLCNSAFNFDGGKVTKTFDVVDLFSKYAPPFGETIWLCSWAGIGEDCTKMFRPILSEDGICFTFNMLNLDQIYTKKVYHNKYFRTDERDSFSWSLEKGYHQGAEGYTYPRRAISAGDQAGLSLFLTAFEQDFDYLCRGPIQGFRILLHHPGEIPRISMQYFRVPLDHEVVVAIRPDMMKTSAGLKDYDPHRRGCYFSSEKQLRFYKDYTQQNCQVECLANFTLKKCGCVAYHMPHTNATPICGYGSLNCIRDAQSWAIADKVNRTASGDDGDSHCDCLPACTSLVYNVETSYADINWKKFFLAFQPNFSETPGLRTATVQIFFKEMQFITSERNELYGVTDFLANCGGLLGLFVGFSFLSLVETLYFLTIRLMVNLKRYGRHFWSASEDLLNNDAYDRHKEI